MRCKRVSRNECIKFISLNEQGKNRRELKRARGDRKKKKRKRAL
jgi:hypothetical protein